MVRLRVREVAAAKGINMSKLSRMADVSYNTIQNIYRDPTRDVTVGVLEKLAIALGVTVNDLIEHIPDQPTS